MLRKRSMRRASVVTIQEKHDDAFKEMRRNFPDASVHDTTRFLQARKFDVPKAVAMYRAHLDWRSKTLPIPYDSVRDTLAARKFYMLDEKDSQGRPAIFYCFRRFKEVDYVVEDEIRALLYVLEEQILPSFGPSLETQQMTVLLDVSGITSPPLRFLQSMNSVMEANYPERLFRLIMFPVPGWLQRMIKATLLFVDKATRDKFAYVNDVESLELFAMMPVDKMGVDIAELVTNGQLRKK